MRIEIVLNIFKSIYFDYFEFLVKKNFKFFLTSQLKIFSKNAE